MGEEHPLTLGAVVARAQVVLGGVAVDLVVDEEVDRKKRPYLRRFAIVPRGSMTRRTASLAPGWQGGKERNLN
jgi:hypothetical protein